MNLLFLECRIAKYFDYRQNVIIPNVSWGIGLDYEADLIVVSKAKYVTEIELKVSKSDLKRDRDKRKWKPKPEYDFRGELYNVVKKQFFGIPEDLGDSINFIPSHCGVIMVRPNGRCHMERAPRILKARPLSGKEYLHALHLASMRTWTLKETLMRRMKGE
jgi:hypothetical protein